MLCCWWKNLGQPTCHSGHKMERNGYTCHTYVCVWVLFVVVYSVTTEWNPMNCSKPGLPLLYYKIPRSYNKWRAGEGKVSSGTKYSCHHALFSLEELCQPGARICGDQGRQVYSILFSRDGWISWEVNQASGIVGWQSGLFCSQVKSSQGQPFKLDNPWACWTYHKRKYLERRGQAFSKYHRKEGQCQKNFTVKQRSNLMF